MHPSPQPLSPEYRREGLLKQRLNDNSQVAQLLGQVRIRLVQDTVKAGRPCSGDVRDQIIHEYALGRLGVRESLAVLEELRVRLAHADLMRQHQRIEMAQHIRELSDELTRMNRIGIAAEQDAIALCEYRDQ